MSSSDLENLLMGLFSLFGIGTTMLFPLLIFGIVFLLFGIFVIAIMIIAGIPLYKMAKNAGFKYPIFAFLPVFQNYLMFFLPQEEFNLFNWIIIKDRHKAALIMTAVTYAPIIIGLLSFIPFIGAVIAPFASLLSIATYIVAWKCYYDLYCLYDVGENTILFSILSLFVVFFSIIITFTLMNKEPEYGFGNIYSASSDKEEAYL